MPRCDNATETEIARMVDRADTETRIRRGHARACRRRRVFNVGQIGRFIIMVDNYGDILAAQDIRRG